MGGDNLEDKSDDKSKENYFWKKGGFASNYEDFEKIKPKNFIAIRLKGYYGGPEGFPDYTTSHYVNREIINNEIQEITLKHNSRTGSEIYQGKKNRLVKYRFPLKGEINLKDFKNGEVKK